MFSISCLRLNYVLIFFDDFLYSSDFKMHNSFTFFSICLSWKFIWMWKWQKNVKLWGFLRQFFCLSLHSWNFRLKHVGMHNCAFWQNLLTWTIGIVLFFSYVLLFLYRTRAIISRSRFEVAKDWCKWSLLTGFLTTSKKMENWDFT